MSIERHVDAELTGEMKSAFLSYAMSTILSRALPDVRDGLKPVHRRVLYAMHNLGLSPDSSYRKCARIVGEVLGKFHPHGDSSVYDALARMAQSFVMRHPLIDGHGNFGSIDADPPAAMRYTEAKLTKLSQDTLMTDIKDGTVDFSDNFDGSEKEPIVLPARVPLLLVNGASGIAVGMATSIPPHNLAEVLDATIALIQQPQLPDSELFHILPGPDFPTGGQIIGQEGCRDLYAKGQGSIILRATYHLETLSARGATLSVQPSNSVGSLKNSEVEPRSVGGVRKQSTATGERVRRALVVTQLPYMCNKAQLLSSIAEVIEQKKVEGVTELRDESDRDGVRIVLELKRDASSSLIIHQLLQKTQLQTTFSGNILALVPSNVTSQELTNQNDAQQPKRLSLRDLLQEFVRFRFATLRRRAHHQLHVAETRRHIVSGLQLALEHVDAVVSIVRNSVDPATAKRLLMQEDGAIRFTAQQADSVLGLTLRRLTSLEIHSLQQEALQLDHRILRLQDFLQKDELVFAAMVEEAQELKRLHGSPRRTQILLSNAEYQLSNNSSSGSFGTVGMQESTLSNEPCVLLVSHAGYAKRVSLEQLPAQSRGGRGRATEFAAAAAVSTVTASDALAMVVTHRERDTLLCVSDRGFVYALSAQQLSRISADRLRNRGVPLPQLLPLQQGERITAVMPISHSLLQSLSPTSPFFAGNLTREPTEHQHQKLCLLTLTEKGFVKKTSLSQLLKQSIERGKARGLKFKSKLKLQSLAEGDAVRWMSLSQSLSNVTEEILVASRRGYISRFASEELRVSPRGNRGVRSMRLRSGDAMASLDTLSNSLQGTQNHTNSGGGSVLLVTRRGMGKRVSISEFRRQHRGRSGLRAIRFKKIRSVIDPAAAAEAEDALVSLHLLRETNEGQDVLLGSTHGALLRVFANHVTKQSRTASGVMLQAVRAGDTVTDSDLTPTGGGELLSGADNESTNESDQKSW